MIQAAIAIAAFLLAVYINWAALKANDLLSPGAILVGCYRMSIELT
jgi:hypothetical protein